MMFMNIKCQYELIVKIIIFVQKPHTDHRHRSIFVICVPAFRRMVVGEGAVFNPDGVPSAGGGAVEGAAFAPAGAAVFWRRYGRRWVGPAKASSTYASATNF